MDYDYHDIFISYAHEDTPSMNNIVSLLGEIGFRVWTDKRSIRSGSQWENQIEDTLSINEIGCLLLLASPHTKNSKYIQKEIQHAQKRKMPIYVLLIKGDESKSIPPALLNHQYKDARGSDMMKTAAVFDLIRDIYDRFKRELFYRFLKNALDPEQLPHAHARASIYRFNKENWSLKVHATFGVFFRTYLDVAFRTGQGLVGKVYEDGKFFYVDDLETYTDRELSDEWKMTSQQRAASKYLRFVLAYPIFSLGAKSYVKGVLVIESPRVQKDMGLETESAMDDYLASLGEICRQLSYFLAIEDNHNFLRTS